MLGFNNMTPLFVYDNFSIKITWVTLCSFLQTQGLGQNMWFHLLCFTITLLFNELTKLLFLFPNATLLLVVDLECSIKHDYLIIPVLKRLSAPVSQGDHIL